MRMLKELAQCAVLLSLSFMTGCIEKDLYNSDEDARKSKLPSVDSYFDFELRGSIPLNVDYGVTGFIANVEVYNEYPLDASGNKKSNVSPVYKTFTKDGKISVNMYVPTIVKEAYLYTERLGLPRCVKLQAGTDGFSYDATDNAAGMTRAAIADGVLNDKIPYQLAPQGRVDNMYSLCTWDVNGKPSTTGYLTKTSYDMDGLTMRIQTFLNENKLENGGKNENLRRDADKLNLSIPIGKGSAKVEVTFVDENGAYDNVFGYYYYETNSSPVTRADFLSLKKYVIFPNAINESRALRCGDTAKLLFFGKNGDSTPTEEFPEGYTIGWFLLSNGAPYASDNGINIKKVSQLYLNGWKEYRNICLSNEQGDDRQFITLYDKKSKLLVVGVEDDFGRYQGDNDFDDVMFCVKTTPELGSADLPFIPDKTPEVKPETETIEGTLAFEDNWPKAGAYDMNDVIIEYKRVFTYNKDNNVTKVEESFTPVQKEDAAVFDNMFAYQINNMGSIVSMDGCEIENDSRSIVITKKVKDIRNQTFTIVRTFGTSINKDELKADFNPYVIVKGIRDRGRAEVHLPKHLPTDLIDRSKLYTENDAYFVDKDGKYPFAIDIPATGFIPADEKQRIDLTGQYPSFKNWVDSKGTLATDWYLKDKGAKK